MLALVSDPAYQRELQELRETWQAKVLAAAAREDHGWVVPNNALGACVLSVLADNFDEAMPTLLRAVFPNFKSLGPPILCSSAKVAKNGMIMADMIRTNGLRIKNQAFFRNENHLQAEFRLLADRLKLSDDARVELFSAVKKWVVCDYRLDPTMDPRDPDAKRLVN